MSFDLKLSNGGLTISNGSFTLVSGSDKLVQDILKIAVTKAGANPYSPWYGSLISKIVVGSALEEPILITAAVTQLQSTLSTLQALQIRQIDLGQPMAASEQIAAINDINIQRNDLDPRLYEVNIACTTRAFRKVTASFTVTPF